MIHTRLFLLLATLSLLCVLRSAPAAAGLGEPPESVGMDQLTLQARRAEPSDNPRYRIEVLSTSSWVLREYVSKASGSVFGIAWNGRVHAPWDRLLGPYTNEFHEALSLPLPHAHGGIRAARSTLRTANLVIERRGHMRSLEGRAYLPSLLPQGVSVDEIR